MDGEVQRKGSLDEAKDGTANGATGGTAILPAGPTGNMWKYWGVTGLIINNAAKSERQRKGSHASISSGSPYQGSPYQGPDSFKERWATYDWAFTASYHNSPAQPPLVEPQLQAVSPPPVSVEEPPQQPPQPPPEPPRRRRNARISVREGPRLSSPQGSSSYPPIPEDPQMSGPSHAVLENDPPPASNAPPPPPVGFDNLIPTYPGSFGYNPSDNGTHDPYLSAAQYNAFYPSSYPLVYPSGYPVQGYQYPPYQQPPPPQQEQT
ncbi:proline-rich receptor-like protein kinase PERK9 [Helianthus annuus]|uniref:proline-rich receptor-like protein kinase PERK9 n=1 Tax=Helianthus annuus TaxID=4232 RepID=UPI000B8F4634|nr:proline-rich receptor-like protein kinase PERK9 [Helianthus annuus]